MLQAGRHLLVFPNGMGCVFFVLGGCLETYFFGIIVEGVLVISHDGHTGIR